MSNPCYHPNLNYTLLVNENQKWPPLGACHKPTGSCQLDTLQGRAAIHPPIAIINLCRVFQILSSMWHQIWARFCWVFLVFYFASAHDERTMKHIATVGQYLTESKSNPTIVISLMKYINVWGDDKQYGVFTNDRYSMPYLSNYGHVLCHYHTRPCAYQWF